MVSAVFTPGTINSLTLRNRIIKTATFEGMIHEGVPTELLLEHHETLARGGVGMTTVAYCAASPNGRTFANQMYMRPELVPALGRLTAAVHAQGAAASIQLGHCGYFTKNKDLTIPKPLGPSARLNPYGITAGLPFAATMTEQDMATTAGEFASSARLARDAGFDAVELHLGHGYLLSQFISPGINERRDEYGGSLDNRMRFPLSVVREVRKAVGADFALIAKMNVSDGFVGGLTIDESVQVAQALERGGIDALELSGGFVDRSALYLLRGGRPLKEMIDVEKSKSQKLVLRMLGRFLIKAFPFKPMFFLDEAKKIREAVKLPLVLLGGITDLAHIEHAMAEGFEFVAMGRALIHDPDLINKYRTGATQRTGCEPCNVCITEMDRPGGVCCARQPVQLRTRQEAVALGRHERPC